MQGHSGPDVWLGLADEPEVTPDMLEVAQVGVLSSQRNDLESWALRCRKGQVSIESWQWNGLETSAVPPKLEDIPSDVLLFVLVVSGGVTTFADQRTELTADAIIDLLVVDSGREHAQRWLSEHGFQEVTARG